MTAALMVTDLLNTVSDSNNRIQTELSKTSPSSAKVEFTENNGTMCNTGFPGVFCHLISTHRIPPWQEGSWCEGLSIMGKGGQQETTQERRVLSVSSDCPPLPAATDVLTALVRDGGNSCSETCLCIHGFALCFPFECKPKSTQVTSAFPSYLSNQFSPLTCKSNPSLQNDKGEKSPTLPSLQWIASAAQHWNSGLATQTKPKTYRNLPASSIFITCLVNKLPRGFCVRCTGNKCGFAPGESCFYPLSLPYSPQF